jgi:hypothetical protein
MRLTALVIILIACTIAALSSCKKYSQTYMNTIEITGPDLTQPACSPNYIAQWQGSQISITGYQLQ